MRRFAPLVLVAACSGSADDAQREKPARIPSTSRATTYSTVSTAAHGASIEALAITDDGIAALTQDGFGGTRLWPTLDGHREPVIVTMPEAVELAIAHDLDGYTLAARDTVGGLEIVRTTIDGRVTSRARVGVEPAIEHLAIASQGVIASRADQTIDIYDATGAVRAHLAPPPGSRVKSIAVRHDHSLVIIERDGRYYGRWLAGVEWGTETQPLPLDGENLPPMVSSAGVSAVLSPSGKQLAIGYGGYVSLVDPAAATPELVGLSADSGRVYGHPLGFLDDNTILVTNMSRQMEIYTLDGHRKPTTINAAVLAIGDDIAVSAVKDSLELTSVERTRYLGYGIAAMKALAFHGETFAIGNQEAQPRKLDGNLGVAAPLSLPDDPRMLADVIRLEDGNVLALHALGGWYTVSIVDPRTKQTVQSLNQASRYPQLVFDPATQLLVVADAASVFLVQRSRTTGRLDLWYRVDVDPAQGTVFLTDPEATGGTIAMIVRSVYSNGHPSSTVRAVGREDLVIGKPVQGVVVLDTDNHVSLVDRRGHIFSVRGDDVVESARGKVIATYAGAKTSTLVPSPDGAYIAAMGESRIRLYKRGGALVWEKAAPLVNDLGWIDGRLVGLYGGGLARLDLENGAFDRRACGWSFGLGTFPPHDPSEGESVCDAR